MTAVRRRFPRALLVVLLALLLLVSGAVVAVSWQSAEALIHPARDASQRDPSDVELTFENVTTITGDGIPLSGWWMPAEGAPRGTVVFLHGYADSKAQSLSVAPFLHRAGYHVLAFDFRAHGRSGGEETTIGLAEAEDVRAAVAYAATRADPSRVALFGWSMGAAAMLNAAADLPQVHAFIADSAFATLENVAGNSITRFTGLPKYPFGPLAVRFAGWMVHRDVGENRPVDRLAALSHPVLLIQGEADDVARPGDDGNALMAVAPAGSLTWLVAGAAHVGSHRADPAAYESQVLAYLDAQLDEAGTLTSGQHVEVTPSGSSRG